MADDGNAMRPERRNALAGYNEELMNALMNPPPREPWAWTKSMPTLAEFLRQGLQYAPLGFAFRGPIPSGPAAGLTPQDFAIANRLSRGPADAAAMPSEGVAPNALALARRYASGARRPAAPSNDPSALSPDAFPFNREPSRGADAVPGTEHWSARMPDSYYYGGVEGVANPATKSLDILGSHLDPEARGLGNGLGMYRRLIDQAHKEGLNVQSDATVSSTASKIYEALARRGYGVERNPKAFPKEHDPEGWRTFNYGEPVFTVRPPRREE